MEMRWALGAVGSFLGWGPQPAGEDGEDLAPSLWEAHVPALLCSWMFYDCASPPPRPHDSKDLSPDDTMAFPGLCLGIWKLICSSLHMTLAPASYEPISFDLLPSSVPCRGAGTQLRQVAPRGHKMLMDNLLTAPLAQDRAGCLLIRNVGWEEVQPPL